MIHHSEHHNFVVRTDYKNICTQIRGFIKKAEKVDRKELLERRKKLAILYDEEQRQLEHEFDVIARSRIDNEFIERYKALNIKKAETRVKTKEFLRKKRIQRNIDDCYEIREAFRQKEIMQTKHDLIKQMLDKQEAEEVRKKEDICFKKLEESLLNSQHSTRQRIYDAQDELAGFCRAIVDVQHEEFLENQEKLRKAKERDHAIFLQRHRRQQLKDMKNSFTPIPQAELDYRQVLVQMAKVKRDAEEAEKKQLIADHLKLIEDMKLLEIDEAKELQARRENKIKVDEEFRHYQKFMQNVAELEKERFNNRSDELRRLDICYKFNIGRNAEIRAKNLAQHYVDLRDQTNQKRLRYYTEQVKEAELNKLWKLPIDGNERTPEEYKQEKLTNKANFAIQVAEVNARYAAAEKERKRLEAHEVNRTKKCSILAERYLRRGTDCLTEHRNWQIENGPTKKKGAHRL